MMKQSATEEERMRYAKELKDKEVMRLAPDDARAYYQMRLLQRGQTVPVSRAPTKQSREDLVVDAYLHTFCQRKRVKPREPIQFDPATRNRIYKLYVAGVLPVRLGGVNI